MTAPEQKQDAPQKAGSVETIDEPLLTDRARIAIAAVLVLLAFAHVFRPDLAIDAVFLGLIAFAALVLLFDIESVEWLGVKARRKAIRKALKQVKEVDVTEVPVNPVPRPPPHVPDSQPEQPTDHRPAFDLMPPVDRAERLLWAVEQIRIELILLAGNSGHLRTKRAWGGYRVPDLARDLVQAKLIPGELLPAIDTVIDQRDEMARGNFGPRVLADSAAALAIEVLIKLREVPRNYNRVRSYPVKLYADQSLTTPRPVSGVRIEQLDSEGAIVSSGVFPTDKGYVAGRYCTWEWDFRESPNEEAWYLDATTQHPTLAYSESAWFAGREFPEQWGVEYRVGGPMRI